MQRRNNIQGQITAGNSQSHSLKLGNLYPSNKYMDRKFSDPEFLPTIESIKQDTGGISYDDYDYGADVARWIRPEQIRWSKESHQYPLTVFNQPQSKDIIQGRLGNCWFVSALSLIADIPHILYKIMLTKQYNPIGLYKIRLCNRGIWQIITIDDLLPVTESNTFVFTRSQKKQLFASLIEKASAKMHGSYKALEYGRCVEGLQTLTGKPCEIFLLQSTDPKKIPDLNQIWMKIVEARDKGYLMTCLSSSTQLNEQFFNQMGLELDHAYSILDARQVGSQRFVRLRNPWGAKEQNTGDGVFSMPWEQMSSFFNDITICKINTYEHEVRKSGQFSNFSSKITSAYTLDCPYGGELDIELFHAGDEKYYNRIKESNIDFFLIVLNSNGVCLAYKHSLDYYITLSTIVPSGQYIIIAGSMSVINYSIYPKYNLVVHATQPFVLNQRPSSCELVGNAFHAVALRANNRKDFGDGVSILTFSDNGGFGFVCENKSNRTIRFTTDFGGSSNVFSSRKTFHMTDIIPAKTKQLFAIFTRRVLSDDVQIVYQAEYQSLNKLHGVDHIRVRNNPPIPRAALGLHVFKPIH